MLKLVFKLLVKDIKNIFTEPVLLYIAVAPITICLLIKYVFLYLNLKLNSGIDLYSYDKLIISIVNMIIPMIVGTLAGFVMLDEKDEGTAFVMVMTPLGKRGYFLYRSIISVVLCFIFVLLSVPMIGISSEDMLLMTSVAIMASLETPICALLLLTIAHNKIEGLAVTKGMVICIFIPICIFFFKNSWVYIMGFIPFFWPAYLFINANNYLLYLLLWIVGFLVHIFYLIILIKSYLRKW